MLVSLQRAGHRGLAVEVLQVAGEHHRIFDGLAGALGHERHHRVAGIAQQGDRALGPERQRVTLIQRGLEHIGAGIKQGAGVRMERLVVAAQLIGIAGAGPRLFVPAVLGGGGEDEDVFALVQREGDDLALRVRPPPFGERLDVRHVRHLLGRHHCAVGHHSGKARMLFAKQRAAHH